MSETDGLLQDAGSQDWASPRSGGEVGVGDLEVGARLRRELSLLDGISVLVGIIMGSGIFTSPGVVLSDAGSVGLGMLAWAAAGAVAVCYALIYAEMGSAFPVAGGDVHYYKVAFGNVVSFVYVWTLYFVFSTGSLAIVTITFAQYLLAGISPLSRTIQGIDPDTFVKVTAITSVIALTFFNCLGVQVGSRLQNAFGVCKVVLVALLVGAAIAFLSTDTAVAQGNAHKPFSGSTVVTLGSAMVAALYAFCGWGDIVYLSEEMKDPVRDVPRAAILSIFIIAVTYLLVNISYLCVLPASAVMNSSVVAVDMTSLALGRWAGITTALLVSVSVLGSANGITLVGGRYLYAAGRDGHIFRSLGCLGKKSKAPVAALVAQSVWCIVLLIQSNGIIELLSYFGTASFVFYGLTAAALIKLRRDLPDLHRPFTLPFFPLLPIFLICVSLYLILSSLVASPVPTCLAFAFILLGFPAYALYQKV